MLHIVTGHARSTRHSHDTVAEARECEEASTAYDQEPPSCPICDAWGCGGAYGRGCDRYERGTFAQQAEEEADRIREMEAAGAWA